MHGVNEQSLAGLIAARWTTGVPFNGQGLNAAGLEAIEPSMHGAWVHMQQHGDLGCTPAMVTV